MTSLSRPASRRHPGVPEEERAAPTVLLRRPPSVPEWSPVVAASRSRPDAAEINSLDEFLSPREETALDLSEEQLSKLRADLEKAVRRACPSWLQSRRDDLVQLAMLKLIAMVQRSEGAVQFSTSYVYRTAYSVMVDEMRRGQWQREVPLESDAPNLEPAVADGNPERDVVSAEIARGIHECLARLVEPRRLAVTLHLQGYSVPEAAEVLAWERKRTENLIYRGLADLRQCLAAKGMTP